MSLDKKLLIVDTETNTTEEYDIKVKEITGFSVDEFKSQGIEKENFYEEENIYEEIVIYSSLSYTLNNYVIECYSEDPRWHLYKLVEYGVSLVVGQHYNFIDQEPVLIYTGREGNWCQFALTTDPLTTWAEVLYYEIPQYIEKTKTSEA